MRGFLFLLFFAICISFAQGQRRLTFDIHEPYLTTDTNWFAHEGDISGGEKKSTDISSWKEVDTLFEKESVQKVIWYRSYLTIPDSLMVPAYTVKLIGSGNNKLYIDEKLVHETGDTKSMLWNYIVPSLYIPNGDSLHVVAVRSDRSGEDVIQVHDDPSIALFDFKKEIRREVLAITIITAFMIFMMTAFLVLAFFHLILFLYYKEEKSNLFLGLFCLLFGMFFMVSLGKLVTNGNSKFSDLFNVVHFLLPFLPVFVLGLFHSIFYGKLKPFFWYYLGSISILRVLEFFEVIDGYSAFISFIVFMDLFRIVIVAVRKKKPGSRIIGLGLIITLLSVPLIFAGFLHSRSSGLMSSEVLVMVGVLASVAMLLLSVPLTMSFHFASRFSKTNRELKTQIIQVSELSAKTLAQEQEKQQILEQQKFYLELQVEERTREVMIQKKQLEEKNKSITDSINYAKRIQHAILHSEEEFKTLYKNSFILYLPKDIVSGDFYWFHRKNDLIYAVAADCTGHGVPGAFMSMIGHTILDDIMNDNEVVKPSTVLTELNARVRDILKQDHGSMTRDGMDIVFSKFDPKTKVMELSSALRPVYIIRNKNIIEIKPDKFPIGGIQEDGNSFSDNLVQLADGDAVYFFSDGYSDQFGGEKGKKFMLKKFQQLLLDIHKLPFDEQKEILHAKHLEWKNELDQVDDILVMGFLID